MSQMRNADMPLLDRIEAVQQRILDGHALRRVPVDATDGDVVLSDCTKEITRLRAENEALRADAERYRYWRDHHGWTGYFDDGASNSEEPTDVDAAIDAVRAALKEAK